MSLFKKILILIPILLILILSVFAIRGSIPMYQGPVSDHFNGTRFFDKEHDYTFIDMLKWLWEMEIVEWPGWINDPPQPKPVEYVNDGRVKITFVPARHNSGRSPLGENRTLWGGFVLEGKSGRVYFAGDTGYGQFLSALKERFSEFHLTIFPIGNYEKRWFMKTQHMNPDDAVKAHVLLNSKQSVGIHLATFLEHPEQTINAHKKDLQAALLTYKVLESEFWILRYGEGRYVK